MQYESDKVDGYMRSRELLITKFNTHTSSSDILIHHESLLDEDVIVI